MADQASSSITVNASPADVMAVISDFAAYPEWAGFVKTAEVLETGGDGRATKARFVVDAGVMKADYTLRYTYEGDEKVSWDLEAGTLKENSGSYTLRDDGGTTHVTYSLTIDAGIPMLGMFKRKAEKVVMDTALKELKKRVESRSA
ncbi:MAG TPA: SRPBCC family protein [Mycobacteriales bacterium]|jgi:ribosome-associated toxin RatA of RatAB toxin-antitoxin module|nr:SRPBCC family protein [Mycobacteriales bacterium]